jgi:DNA-binding XRE family transcriptional regulator
MTVRKWADIKARKLSAEQIASIRREAEQELLQMTLRELREMAGKTQAEVADLVEMTQSALSKMERRDDAPIPTLRRYVQALGGELEVVAVIGNKRVTLAGI